MSAWAIVVGINQYGPNSGLRTLHGAVADAVDFADWLLDPQGGEVAPENLFFWTCPAPAGAIPARVAAYLENPTQWLIGPDFTHAPTVGELLAGISDINAKAVAAGATRLYVLFAGHGAQTQPQSISEEPQNCFMAGDYLAKLPATGMINCDDMKRYLKSQGPAEIVIFLDCCRNPLPLKVLRPGTGFNNSAPGGANKRLAVCRSAQDEAVAYEVPLVPGQPERGAFTQLLTFGLRELRTDGKLTLRQLDEYVTEALKEVVRPKEQVPDFDEKPKPPAIVLVEGPSAGILPRLRIALPGLPPGSQVELRDEGDAVVQMLSASAAPISLALARGGYSLEQNGQVLKAFNHVGPGTPDVVI